jgi:hypothetical protein
MPLTVTHGDFRAENLFFGAAAPRPPGGGTEGRAGSAARRGEPRPGTSPRVAMVDFQLCSQAWGVGDVTYMMSGSLPVAVRRRHHRALLEARRGLGRVVASHYHSPTSYRFTNIFRTSVSEAATRPNPRRIATAYAPSTTRRTAAAGGPRRRKEGWRRSTAGRSMCSTTK